jgi:hypothetical protein
MKNTCEKLVLSIEKDVFKLSLLEERAGQLSSE